MKMSLFAVVVKPWNNKNFVLFTPPLAPIPGFSWQKRRVRALHYIYGCMWDYKGMSRAGRRNATNEERELAGRKRVRGTWRNLRVGIDIEWNTRRPSHNWWSCHWCTARAIFLPFFFIRKSSVYICRDVLHISTHRLTGKLCIFF